MSGGWLEPSRRFWIQFLLCLIKREMVTVTQVLGNKRGDVVKLADRVEENVCFIRFLNIPDYTFPSHSCLIFDKPRWTTYRPGWVIGLIT